MSIHNRARELAKSVVDAEWRQMRRNGLNPDDERIWPVRAIKENIRQQLAAEVDPQGKQKFGSFEIWFYVFWTLGKVIIELIRERRKETWGMGPVQ